MDDKLAGEAAKLATQAQDLAANLKSVAQQILDMSAQGTLDDRPTATCRSSRCSPSSRWPASSATTWCGG